MVFQKHIERLLLQAGLSPVPQSTYVSLAGDGSDRSFFRIALLSGGSCLAVFPSASMTTREALAESYSTYAIAKHLKNNGVSVPQVYAYDTTTGGVLFEYLGNTLLYDIVKKCNSSPFDYYRQALDELVLFQVKGVTGFKESYSWDTSLYDRQLMLSRESGYFLREFCSEYLGLSSFSEQLEADFKSLADRVSREGHDYLLHRDFQSRNLMVNDKRVFIIDFQGARFGPLGYDVASFINDPYIGLDSEQKTELLDYYLKTVSSYLACTPAQFIRGYYHIALQRNLQVLGAYAFLSQKKSKLFFKDFIEPAFASLSTLIRGDLAGRYPGLEKLITEIADNKLVQLQVRNR